MTGEVELTMHQFDRLLEPLWCIAETVCPSSRNERVAALASRLVPNDPISFTPVEAVAYSFEVAELWVAEAERRAKVTP